MLTTKNINLQLLIGAALASEVLYLLLAAVDLAGNIPLFLLLYGAVFVVYWWAAVTFFDFKSKNQTETQKAEPRRQRNSRTPLRWLHTFIAKQKSRERLRPKEILTVGLVFAAIFRLTLLAGTPSLSDDIYRYVWDGKAAAAGINPYEHPPAAEELRSLRDHPIYPNINHKEISTIYQPVHQLVFETLYRIHPSLFAFKAAFVLVDLLTMLFLFLIMKRLAIPSVRLLLYAWNPLVLLEISGSGHADIIGICLLVLACLLLLQRRWITATISLAFSALTKFIAVVFLPLLMRAKKEARLIPFLLFLIIGGLLYLPYADAGTQIFEGLLTYTEKWRFNGLAFWLILAGVEALLPRSLIVNLMIRPQGMTADAATIATRGTDLALYISKFIVMAAFTAIILYYILKLNKDLKQKGESWYMHLGMIFLGAFILLSPTVHPWYVCWILPFAVVTRNRAWILFSGLVALSYWILRDYAVLGVWQESPSVMILEYLPFLMLLVYDSLAENLKQGAAFFKSKFRLSSP